MAGQQTDDIDNAREAIVDLMHIFITLKNITLAGIGEIRDIATCAALQEMGIDIDRPITDAKIGDALGQMVENEVGFYIGNIFDREQVKRALLAGACKVAIQELGGSEAYTPEGVARAVEKHVRRKVVDAIGQGDSAILERVKVGQSVLNQLKEKIDGFNPDYNRITDYSTAGHNNRERQKRWRENHRRVYE